MAGDIRLTPLLLGLGIDELSVGPHHVPRVRQAVRALNFSDCQALAEEALKTRLSSVIMDSTVTLATAHYGELLE
jgi:phosphoenolpyruvate-protein phosphotransferase (PTS system enzyme I)